MKETNSTKTKMTMHGKDSTSPRDPFRRLFIFAISTVAILLPLHIYLLMELPDALPLFSSHSLCRSLAQEREKHSGDDGNSSRNLSGDATKASNDTVEFLPLKDLRFAGSPTKGHTWFMSSLNDSFAPDVAQHLHFPSGASGGRLLCLAGGDRSNGTRNSYALVRCEGLPRGAVLRPGLTFVSDSYYDYRNPWHGLAASVPFVGWHIWRGCARPARWVLFHWGEVRDGMGTWLRTLMEATFGQGVEVDMINHRGGATCFEEAVVFRHNEGSIPSLKRREIYDTMRCRARRYCNVAGGGGGRGEIRMTLFLRTGSRSFRNESAVIDVFRRECVKVPGCRVAVERPDNLTFCDQVRVMSNTDLLISQHGAQLTNMIFMDKNSSVMEFFPKGWKELAGVGQYVFKWISKSSGMRHQGAYKESFYGRGGGGGTPCPFPPMDIRCFTYYKGWQIGLNESYFAEWTNRVLKEVKDYKLNETSMLRGQCQMCV